MMDGAYIGEVRIFAGSFEPQGWKLCNGATLQTRHYSALYAIIGNKYGGNGSDSFQLPSIQPLKEVDGGTTKINYYICVSGMFPSRT